MPQDLATTLITCHTNADWDALASIIGASLLYPNSVLVFPGSMERSVTTFFNETARNRYNFKSIKEIDPDAVATLVVVDTCQPGRIEHVAALLKQPNIAVHVWDHHPQDSACIADEYHGAPFGSTSSLIINALRARNLNITPDDATLLGLGVYADTGAFTYASTTQEDFQAAAWLLGQGMNLDAIGRMLQQDLTGQHIKLLSSLLESASTHNIKGYLVTLAEARMDTFVGDFAQVVQRFMEMESTQALFALGILDDRIQIIARSRVDAVDAGAVCKALGGGGHRYAASAAVKTLALPELKDAIFQQLYAQLNPQRTAKDLMSSPAVGIEDKNRLLDAETAMTRYGLKAAPVFRAGTRQCVGLLETQTASLALNHGLGHLPVHIYMRRNPSMVSPDASLQTLMDIIVGSGQRLVPVAERDDVIGVVTRTDLIRLFVEDQGRLPLPREETKERDLSRMLSSRLPRPLYNLLRTAGELGDKLGVGVYAVGGFVRDILLTRPSKEFEDIDLVVEGDGLAFARDLGRVLNGRVREHQAFLTALVIYTNEDGVEQRVDVATARLEYYSYPAALPTVELSSIKMDLFRRDFTINAMALRVNKSRFGHLVDFFGGQSDIQRKTVRVLHALSFVEDPTRILRAIRFALRYQFRLAGQTTRLIKNAVDLQLIDKLSGIRIAHELNAALKERSPLTCFEQFQKTGILAAIHPALTLTPARRSLLAKVENVLEWYRLLYLHKTVSLPTLYLLAITDNLDETSTLSIIDRLSVRASIQRLLLRLRASIRALTPALTAWHKHNGPISALCALLATLPLEGTLYLMAQAPNEAASKNISLYINRWSLIRADIDGTDLLRMGLAPGPLYGHILRAVWNAKLDGLVESRDDQLKLAHELIREADAASNASTESQDISRRL